CKWEYNRGNGFTLIELIMVIVIVGILAVPAAYIMMHFVQNTVYLPGQMTTDMILERIQDVVIEGDATAKGLRFSRAMSSIADNDLTFVNQDGDTVRYRLDTGTGNLYRSINSGTEVLVPYYLPSGVTISGLNGALFTYYNGAEAETATVQDVRWISVGLTVKDGAGDVERWEGRSEGLSAVYVPRFQ
ncbi:MAG TPA: type II secretion system protein, partial [Candidatus Omnitrophota bacterium]|nr:type II secretion system protein [Candidatus Omnitrophota bacterium]